MMKQNRKRSISFFSVCVLLVVFGTVLNLWKGEQNPLLDKSGAQTLYVTISPGEELNLQASQYFEEGLLDEGRIRYDTSQCDSEKPGVYRVPVLYDGKETNCVFEVTVEEKKDAGNLADKLVPGTDKNTEQIRICE